MTVSIQILVLMYDRTRLLTSMVYRQPICTQKRIHIVILNEGRSYLQHCRT